MQQGISLNVSALSPRTNSVDTSIVNFNTEPCYGNNKQNAAAAPAAVFSTPSLLLATSSQTQNG